MDNENDVITSQRSNGQNGGDTWGARDSLRRNAGLDKKTDDESTPLLGSGEATESREGRIGEGEWEGYADFTGLPFWKTPSVSGLQSLSAQD